MSNDPKVSNSDDKLIMILIVAVTVSAIIFFIYFVNILIHNPEYKCTKMQNIETVLIDKKSNKTETQTKAVCTEYIKDKSLYEVLFHEK